MINLDKILSEQFLNKFLWEKLFERYNFSDVTDSTLAKLAFYEGRVEVLESILNGTYEWNPVIVKHIPKDDGTYRTVYTLTDIDRIIMSALTEVYSGNFDYMISPYCVSYREGYSVSSVVRKIRSKGIFKGYKIDLSKYFDSVPSDCIEKCLNQLYSVSAFTKLLLKFYKDDSCVIDGIEVKRFRSLCQGCSFSGFLSNIILRELDNELGSKCDVYYRYSDDMILLGDNAEECLELLYKRLEDFGLVINEKKLSKIDGEFTFLGVKISKDYLRWSDNKRDRIRKKISDLSKKYKSKDRVAQRKFIYSIQKYLLQEVDGYSYFSQLCSLNTDGYDICWLSKYCKDSVRALYTGSHNYTRNKNKTSDQMLKDLGWINLDFLQLCYKKNLDLYKVMVKHILCKQKKRPKEFIPVIKVLSNLNLIKVKDIDLKNQRIIIDGVPYRIERGKYANFESAVSQLWKYAKYCSTDNPLNTCKSNLTEEESDMCEDALKRILILILSVEFEFEGFYKQCDDLILLKDWFIPTAPIE